MEGLSGETCDTLKRLGPACRRLGQLLLANRRFRESETSLTVPAATSDVDRTLAAWPRNPAAAQRRRLAMLFLAAGDRASAVVQWLRLPEAERKAGDRLTVAMVETILRKGRPPNENYAIGSVLAARLGLERVYLVDHHLADGPEREKAYGEAIQKVWSIKPEPAIFTEYKRRQAQFRTPDEVIAYYRWAKEPETQRASIAADMGARRKRTTRRSYMAANICPGGRTATCAWSPTSAARLPASPTPVSS
ncbi:MAG: hypothetical protein AVDCRST_MAG44-555 [uncultured Sphingomonas sp.]|uniref:Uncharacterized protein n=1 Tax=uncultured Sphingomonas sp. TaxID=158754 RepID=A0A6J4SMH2_9SPHN|nr:MAG: hypothetical protein AVDCRST_MAG44-555 [uncultured Sphingomonas sp.]